MSDSEQVKKSPGEPGEVKRESPGESEEFLAIRDIRSLMDYVDRSCPNRFVAPFEGTLARAAATAEPPLKSYHDLLSRLTEIEKRIQTPETSSNDPKELQFLRWGRNFLSIMAAPATLDSIRTTREFIDERAHLALFPWWKIWQRGRVAASVKNIDLGAKWLARSVRRLERWMIAATVFTVLLSAYAMVGKYISDQKTDALQRYQKAGEILRADKALVWQVQSSGVLGNAFNNPCLSDVANPPMDATDITIHKASAAEAAAVSVDVAALQAAQKLEQDCEEFRREAYHLMAEDIRLRSWENILIGRREEWTWATISHVAWPILGWSNDVVEQVAERVDPAFCKNLKLDNHADTNEDTNTKKDCENAVYGIVEGTGSTSSAILGCISLYLVPALYSLIGAGAATMRYLRRRVDTSTLVVTDRPRISYNLILGCAFGAIIGLFARYFGAETAIGPAAVALLAGFNVPAVFSFLGELSNRVFGIAEGADAAASKGLGIAPAGPAATAGGA